MVDPFEQLVGQCWNYQVGGFPLNMSLRVFRIINVVVRFRAFLHGVGEPQIGEVTCGGSPHLSCKRDQLKWEIIWTGGSPHLSELPHLHGVPHLHVNSSLVKSPRGGRSYLFVVLIPVGHRLKYQK